jgi:hypothetical protein
MLLALLACGTPPAVAVSPLPYPLPANISFGICGDLPPAVNVPGCSAPVTLSTTVSVTCSSKAGCDGSCARSTLVQGVFVRYGARLSGGGGAAPAPPPVESAIISAAAAAAAATTSASATGGSSDGHAQQRHWWRLNSADCRLHDLLGVTCPVAGGPEACKAVCEAHPDCGGFLYYNRQGGRMALKTSSCWDGVASLPRSSDGDLYVMRAIPVPPPLSAAGVELSTVEVCLLGSSEELGTANDSYS